jgi:hypothetical protein
VSYAIVQAIDEVTAEDTHCPQCGFGR